MIQYNRLLIATTGDNEVGTDGDLMEVSLPSVLKPYY